MNKNETARYEGAVWGLELAKKKGFEEAEKELRWRGAYNCTLQMEMSEVKKYQTCILNLMSILTIGVLADELELSHEQICEFKKRFDLRTECINENYVDWRDLRDEIAERFDIHILLPEDM